MVDSEKNFEEYAKQVVSRLNEVSNLNLNYRDYDAVLLKTIRSSNLVGTDKERKSKQSHIAITGESRDIFPYVDIRGYKEQKINELKSFYILQIPVILYKNNIEYANSSYTNKFNFDSKGTISTKVSSKLSCRSKSDPQIEFGNTSQSDSNFALFREIFNNGDNIVILKRSSQFKYDVALLKENDSQDIEPTFKIVPNGRKGGAIVPSSAISVEGDNLNNTTVKRKGENVIFYGAPGTGKSHDLQEYIREFEGMENYENSKAAPNVFRVTLHPEYDYSDFVGQLLPETKDGVITYEYRAGVFAKSLDYALKHPNEYTFMILEEMSRANVAAVFGDLFQLLDRDENGRSEYVVNNPMLAKLVYGTESEEQAIHIPANLNIIGTVNTSDQNVFAMDTAFKRRFRWIYKSTNVDEASFKNNPQLEWIKGEEVSWYNFYTTLNDYITETLGLSEDKQIGPYFIKFNEQQDSHVLLQDKLLQYLWEDVENVARNNFSNEKTLFDKKIGSFSKLYDKFSAYENIFSEDLSKELSSKATIVEHAVGQVEDTISDNPDF